MFRGSLTSCRPTEWRSAATRGPVSLPRDFMSFPPMQKIGPQNTFRFASPLPSSKTWMPPSSISTASLRETVDMLDGGIQVFDDGKGDAKRKVFCGPIFCIGGKDMKSLGKLTGPRVAADLHSVGLQ